MGRSALHRRGSGLSQRASHRHRTDRNDRPSDGLRHDRHRAGFRAREVQEARRRRLLQDRQSIRRCRVAASSATPDEQIEAIETYAKGTGTLDEAPHINRATLQSQRLRRRSDWRGSRRRCRAPSSCRSSSINSCSAKSSAKTKLGLTEEQLNDWNFSILRDGLGFSTQQIEEASAHICGRMTVEGAPYLKDEHLAGLRLRDAVRQIRHALHSSARARRYDGGRATVRQRRDLKDDQPSANGDDRRRQGSLPLLVGTHDQGRRALSRRLEALAAARRQLRPRRRRREGRGCAYDSNRSCNRCRSPRRSSIATSPSAARCRERRSGYTQKATIAAVTKSTCAPANTKAANSARSSSTCTRKARPSAR